MNKTPEAFSCSENLGFRFETYVEQRPSAAKNEINRALDVAIMVVMSAFVIEQCVVGAKESTMVKCNPICTHKYRH